MCSQLDDDPIPDDGETDWMVALFASTPVDRNRQSEVSELERMWNLKENR